MSRRRQQGSSVFDDVDAWLDRVQIVDEGDDEVARFLDTLDLHGPQEREMLEELARKTPLAKPESSPPRIAEPWRRWRRSAATATAPR